MNKTDVGKIDNLLNEFMSESFITPLWQAEDIPLVTKGKRELDLIPYVAAAVAYPKFVRDDILKLFEKNKGAFYDAAEKSEHFNSIIFRELTLEHATVAIKSLGILEYIKNTMLNANEKDTDTEVLNCYDQEIFSLMKKGYKKVYSFFKRYPKGAEIDMNEFMLYIMNFFFNEEKLSTEEAVHSLTAAFYFANEIGTVTNDEVLGSYLLNRHDFLNGKGRLSLDTAEPVLKKEVEKLRKQIPKNIATTFRNDHGDDGLPYEYIYDLEEISSISLFDNFTLTKKDIDELLLAYAAVEKNNKIPLETYIIAGMHIKSLLKAYKKAKDFYFSNNKASAYVEIEKLKSSLSEAKSLYNNEKQTNEELRKKLEISATKVSDEVHELEIKNQKLLEEIEELQKEKKEINALREWIFRQTNTVEYTSEENDTAFEQAIEQLNKLKGMIIGGHPNWKKKLEAYLTGWTFVPAEINPDPKLVVNSDIVIFNTAHLSHSVYNFAMNIIKECDCRMGYVQSTNIKKAALEIMEQTQ